MVLSGSRVFKEQDSWENDQKKQIREVSSRRTKGGLSKLCVMLPLRSCLDFRHHCNAQFVEIFVLAE